MVSAAEMVHELEERRVKVSVELLNHARVDALMGGHDKSARCLEFLVEKLNQRLFAQAIMKTSVWIGMYPADPGVRHITLAREVCKFARGKRGTWDAVRDAAVHVPAVAAQVPALHAYFTSGIPVDVNDLVQKLVAASDKVNSLSRNMDSGRGDAGSRGPGGPLSHASNRLATPEELSGVTMVSSLNGTMAFMAFMAGKAAGDAREAILTAHKALCALMANFSLTHGGVQEKGVQDVEAELQLLYRVHQKALANIRESGAPPPVLPMDRATIVAAGDNLGDAMQAEAVFVEKPLPEDAEDGTAGEDGDA